MKSNREWTHKGGTPTEILCGLMVLLFGIAVIAKIGVKSYRCWVEGLTWEEAGVEIVPTELGETTTNLGTTFRVSPDDSSGTRYPVCINFVDDEQAKEVPCPDGANWTAYGWTTSSSLSAGTIEFMAADNAGRPRCFILIVNAPGRKPSLTKCK